MDCILYKLILQQTYKVLKMKSDYLNVIIAVI